jgi:hypothetical protein
VNQEVPRGYEEVLCALQVLILADRHDKLKQELQDLAARADALVDAQLAQEEAGRKAAGHTAGDGKQHHAYSTLDFHGVLHWCSF